MKRKRNPERPELNRIRVNRWRAAHPETERLRSQRKHLKKKYGITLEQITRGLLCYQCNISLGMLYESEGVIRGLADYLSQWEVAP